MHAAPPPPEPRDLDPEDWPGTRAQAHRMLDDILDYVQGIRERPVWRPIPEEVRAALRQPLPTGPTGLDRGARRVPPPDPAVRAPGNVHTRVHGTGVHGAAATWRACWARCWPPGLKRQPGRGATTCPSRWSARSCAGLRRVFGPAGGNRGLVFVTGSSMANFMAVLAARTWALGPEVRRRGLGAGSGLAAYASTATHSCVRRAMEMSGLGSDRPAGCCRWTRPGRMDLAALGQAVARDRQGRPAPVPGGGERSGTVDNRRHRPPWPPWPTPARAEGLWFHVDGAFRRPGGVRPRPRPAPARASRRRTRSPWTSTSGARFRTMRATCWSGTAQTAPGDTFASPAALPGSGAQGLGGRFTLALRLRPGPVPGLPGPEDLVHPQGPRHREAGLGDRAHLRPRPLPGGPGAGLPGPGS